MSTELKPCPFCGPGESVVGLWHDDLANRWRVGCGRCGCSTGISPRDKTEEPAIQSWNNRAPPLAWIRKAQRLAREAHRMQEDKAGCPYIWHVTRVADAVRGDDEAEVVAWLHDVMEDCPLFADQVMTFPRAIRKAVTLLSRNFGDRDGYYARIRANPLALKVKLADINDNASPERLAMLDPAVAERLRKKYGAALVALLG